MWGENPSIVGVLPPHTPYSKALMRVAPQRRGALAHWGGRRGSPPADDPSPDPSRACRGLEGWARAVLLHPSRGSLGFRKVGEGKLSTSFPSPPGKVRGIATKMRRTAKEVGGGGGTAASRQTSAFEMVSPSAKTAERVLLLLCGKFGFVSLAVGMYF